MDYPLNILCDLVSEAYMSGRVNQQEQADMIGVINQFSLKPYIKHGRATKTAIDDSVGK